MKFFVCLIAPFPPPYGGISHWASLVRRRANADCHVKMVAIDTAARWRSIHNSSVVVRALFGGYHLILDSVELIRHLSTKPFSIIHLTTSGRLAVLRDLLMITIARYFGVPLIYHIHFGRLPEISKKKFSLEWLLMTFVMRLANTVITIDRATYQSVHTALPNVHVKNISNGIDLESLATEQNGDRLDKVVLFLGWVVESKGIGELLDAWSRLRLLGWKLKIIGPFGSDYFDSLNNRYSMYNVEFLGELPHNAAMGMLSECELFVLPSYTEGFPNVILEAMAFGKAIVATDVGAISEMLAGDCGSLVCPRDAVDLENAMRNLMINAELRAEFGQRAIARVRSLYGLDVIFEKYQAIWQECIELKSTFKY